MPKETIEILKIKISNVNYSDALEEIRKWLKNGGVKHIIVTPNPEILVAAQKNSALREILNGADLAIPDGVGLLWASRFLGQPLRRRVTGIDFMEKLCQLAAKEGLTVGLIGGGKQVAVKVAECLKKRYPGLRVMLAAEEWPNEGAEVARQRFFRLPFSARSNVSSNPDLLVARKGSTQKSGGLPAPEKSNLAMKQCNNEAIDILFVAFGAPKQEIWISENLPHLPVKVAMGVGGAFDYISGVVPRAPKWMQNLGLEWLFRLVRQPWRLKRQLALLKFIYLIFQARFGRIEKYL